MSRKDLDTGWARRAFGLDFVGPRLPLPEYPVDKKIPLRKVFEAIPLSPLGATLQSMSLTRGQWIDLASSELLAGVVAKWNKLCEGAESVVFHYKSLLAFRDITFVYKTFDDFKSCSNFRFLTSGLSFADVLQEHYGSNRNQISALFSNLESSAASRKLKKAVLDLLRGDLGGKYSVEYLLLVIIIVLGFMGKVTDVDGFIAVVCKTLPPENVSSDYYSKICAWQKGSSKSDENQLASSGAWFVKRDNVHLRNGPGVNFDSVVRLREYGTFQLVEDPGTGWLKIKTEVQGLRYEGWMAKRFAVHIKDSKK